MTSSEHRCPPADPDVLRDYEHLTQGCGMVDVSERTQIELQGDDRQRFLHNLCTNDIQTLQPGQGCEAFVTSVQGKCLGHVFVFVGEQSIVVDTSPGQAATLLAHWDRYLISEDVQLTDRSGQWGELLVAGPETTARLRAMTTNWELDTPGDHQRLVVGDGLEVWVRRVAMTAAPTFFVACQRTALPDLKRNLESLEIAECGWAAMHMARVEQGFPWYGWDITDKNLPQEVNRNDIAISFKKGCYLGQETVARIDALGHVNHLLLGVRCHEPGVPRFGTSLRVDGQVVGEITSSAYSPRLQSPLALAYLRSSFSQPGTPLTINDQPAEVVALPLTDK